MSAVPGGRSRPTDTPARILLDVVVFIVFTTAVGVVLIALGA